MGQSTSVWDALDAAGLNEQATQLYNQGRYSEAIPLAQRELAIREKTLGPDHPDVAQSLNLLANLYDAQGNYADAEFLYQRSLAIREKSLGPDHPLVADALNNLANLYTKQGRLADAERLYKRSLAIYEKTLDPDHHVVARSLRILRAFTLSKVAMLMRGPCSNSQWRYSKKPLAPTALRSQMH